MLFKKAAKASAVRLCYLIHGSVGVFLTVYLEQNGYYWFIAITFLVYVIEMYLTFSYNEDGEWKWFFPLVLIYLATVVPVVWILEMSLLNFRIELQDRLEQTSCTVRPFTFDTSSDRRAICNCSHGVFSQHEQNSYNTKLILSTIYQQTLMLVLILGRWFLPKGGLTRDELSQLLLVYIGMAADMLEFSSETLKLPEIACRREVYVAILAVWSWSLLQFTLGLTSTKRRRRNLIMTAEETERWTRSLRELSSVFCGTALWALMTDVILQDGPYLIMRLYLITSLQLLDQSLVFYTCKNALLLMLQFYRLYVVMTGTRKRGTSRVQRGGLVMRDTRSHEKHFGWGLRRRKSSARSSHRARSNGVVPSISQEITVLE